MRILKIQEVMSQMGVRSRNTLRRYCSIGLLTKPVRVGLQSGGWPDFEVEAILQARVAGVDDLQIQALVKQLHDQRTNPVAAQ